MGYLKSLGTGFVYIITFLAAVTFIPGLPPDVEFSEYSIVKPKDLPNHLASNDRLNDAEILFTGKLKGAEAFDSYGDELYSGIYGGHVIKFDRNRFDPVTKFGKACEDFWELIKCGRPLGLKFDKHGALYVADAYYGIFKVDVRTGKYEKIVDPNVPIKGKVPRIFNYVDVASNGDLYWSDSSSDFSLHDGFYSMFTAPSGRLIRYNAATKKNEVLIENLLFANGVKLSHDESFVIVAETFRSRIMKYNIKGPKTGQREVFAEGLPGLPDNIHSDGGKGFLVALVSTADTEHPQIVQSLTPHPYIRKLITRLVTLAEAPFKLLEDVYPNYYSRRIVYMIGSFEPLNGLFGKKVTVLRLDETGKIIDALHSTDGKISTISSAFIHKGYLWLGSPHNEFIARVPLKQAFPDLSIEKEQIHKTQDQPIWVSTISTEPPTKATPKPPSAASKAVPTTPKPSQSTTTTTSKPTKSDKATTTSKPTTSNKVTTTSKPTSTTNKPSTNSAKVPESDNDSNSKMRKDTKASIGKQNDKSNKQKDEKDARSETVSSKTGSGKSQNSKQENAASAGKDSKNRPVQSNELK
ncbi:adipocyte plasma membrane-associated protein [Orussus abietinus]|uniref:adipocyte plasma membrane-associated protein n=1 Tax=Orussus abietinus TaxID=222816 RepID=UPI000625A239|nr:adipocyte plasma membrane-associated protein [Orussus abietinus]XP_012272004.1 adipocyte plasma membrane-associated protein [Orussus abietinus]XP_012272005.1 adipocyte plasma membrane-associated protein [Orussus abietinus]